MKKKELKKEVGELRKELKNRIMLDILYNELDESKMVSRKIKDSILKLQERVYG